MPVRPRRSSPTLTPRASTDPGAAPGFSDATLLDALPSQFAVVDASGRVRASNRSWRSSVRSEDYFAEWERLAPADADLLAQVRRGLAAVLSDGAPELVIEYDAWSEALPRSVLLRAAPCQVRHERLALVAHVDVTARKVAERFSAIQRETLAMVAGDGALGTTLERLASLVAREIPQAACTIHTPATDGTALTLAAESGFAPDRRDRILRAPTAAFGLPEPGHVRLVPLSSLEASDARTAGLELGFAAVAAAAIRSSHDHDLGLLVVWVDGREATGRRAVELVELAGPLAAIAIARHQTAWALRERETRLQSVFSLHPDAVLILDSQGLIQTLNPAAEQLLAGPPEDFVGRTFARLVPAHLVPRFDERLRRALTGYAQRFTIAIHPPGRPRTELDVTFVPLLSSGSVGGVYMVAKDLAEPPGRDGSEQPSGQLWEPAKMEVVGRLAGALAHDFDNILTTIRGYADTLAREQSLSHPARRDLVEVTRAVDRGSALTKQLLTFGRQQPVQRRRVDLNAVVAESRGLIGRLARADTDVVLHLADEPLPVLGDSGQLQQVLVNLVLNALDAMPEGGRLTITTRRHDAGRDGERTLAPLEAGLHAVLEVRDTGQGMDRETQEHVFEPFFTTKPPGQGTGLGLATVFGIVEQSGGRVGFESAVGRGTTFAVYLPEQPADEPSPADTATPSAPVRAGGETILLAEDDESVRRMVARVLTSAGYAVLEARHGAEALRVSRAHQGHIDLLLTDVVMPELNGVRLAHILAQERPDTRVVFMSGYTRDEVDRRGLMEPDVVLVPKPFTVAQLSQVVRAVLDAREPRPPLEI